MTGNQPTKGTEAQGSPQALPTASNRSLFLERAESFTITDLPALPNIVGLVYIYRARFAIQPPTTDFCGDRLQEATSGDSVSTTQTPANLISRLQSRCLEFESEMALSV